MKRVFVSGGSGVIGMELIPKLSALGAKVLVGDLKPRPKSFSKDVQYRQGDLNTMTAQELEAFAPDLFIHLAATFERSTESYEFWSDNFSHNIQLSHHLMTLAKDSPGLRRVVFASSYLIYLPALYQFPDARSTAVSLVETDPVSPRNLTGMAKLAHEIELDFLESFRSTQFSSVCARIFRGYGRGSRDVISRWVRSLLDGEPIKLYRPEGLFDYIYASDTAEGLIRLADAPCKGIVNLGTGRARRVSDVVDVLRRHFPGMEVSLGEADIPFEASQADTSRLLDVTGWQPEHDLESAIALIVEHERAQHSDLDGPITTRPPRILVTSASRKVPLVRAMQEAARAIHPGARVIAGDTDANALSFYVADETWTMPHLTDSELNVVMEHCRSHGITAILPTRDGELMFWSRHYKHFCQIGVEVMVSNPESLQRCLDKFAFSNYGAKEGLPLIPAVMTAEELHVERFVVKERFGAGSRGIGLDLDITQAIAHASTLQAPIFQPFVEGREISIDAWLNRDCELKGLVLRRRDVVANGESQITTTFRDPALESEAASILAKLSLRGPVVMQAIIDVNDRMHIIECNPRFGGASTVSLAVGLESLRWSLLEAGGANIDEYTFHRSHLEIRQVRTSQDILTYDTNL